MSQNNNQSKYNLNFISDADLLNHVTKTVEQYSFIIDLKKFNKNIVDPIKLTFDKLIYKKTMEEIIDAEVIRQMDKTNNNTIGHFHQNIFKYIGGNDWEVPKTGFDVVNKTKKFFVEMKNKHNTMNSSSSQKTYMKMLHQLVADGNSTCMLVEIVAQKSQNIIWTMTLDGERKSVEKIRRVSIDKFYEIVTGDKEAFKKLCEVLPTVINDAIKSLKHDIITKSVIDELKALSTDILSSLYLVAFKTYEGFDNFKVDDNRNIKNI